MEETRINIDIKELIARASVDATINDFILKAKEGSPEEWKEFVDNIINNNYILDILKNDVYIKSKYGVNYVAFEFFNDNIYIYNALVEPDTNYNDNYRVNQQNEKLLKLYRVVGNSNYMEQSSVRELHTTTKTLRIANNLAGAKNIVLGEFVVETDAYEQYILNTKELVHNYGVLTAKEFKNRPKLDFGNYSNNLILSDWYVARDLINELSELISYASIERKTNKTRIVAPISNHNEFTDSTNSIFRMRDENYLKSPLILYSTIDKDNFHLIQSTYKPFEYYRAINSLLDIIFKMCGYVWNQANNETYQNVQATTSRNRAIYETTKMKIELFTTEWLDFLQRIAIAWFKTKRYGDKPINSVEFRRLKRKIIDEFNDNVSFELISNLIKDYDNNTQDVIDLYNTGLMSLETAVKKLYSSQTQEEQEEEIELLKSKIKEFDVDV